MGRRDLRHAARQREGAFAPGDFQPVNVEEVMQMVRAKPANFRVDKFELYLTNRNKWLQKRGIFFSFDLFLTNKGRALATNIQMEITFPPFIRLFDDDFSIVSRRVVDCVAKLFPVRSFRYTDR